jgi:Flp pilus assembly protein TadD
VTRYTLVFALLIAAADCLAARPLRPALSQDELLQGAALFGSPAAQEPLATEAVLAIDEEIRAFVSAQIDGIANPEAKLRRLLAGMRDRGLFALDYTGTTTRTVRETFHAREGNCLSATMLFVALAREAGLRVSYQMVDIPPIWSSDSDVVMLNDHINALIESTYRTDYVVDFNLLDTKGNYETRKVSDNYALALFYSNRGAESLIDADYAQSFAELRAAIVAYPQIPGPWVNLGVLYSRRGLVEHAESAYLHALAADSGNRSALTNLASLYASIRDEASADVYRKRVRAYLERNPYYHYSLAQQAYREQRFAAALDMLDTAIRLKRDEHQFYFLKALAYYGLGQRRDAEKSLIDARETATLAEIRDRYNSKIEALL